MHLNEGRASVEEGYYDGRFGRRDEMPATPPTQVGSDGPDLQSRREPERRGAQEWRRCTIFLFFVVVTAAAAVIVSIVAACFLHRCRACFFSTT